MCDPRAEAQLKFDGHRVGGLTDCEDENPPRTFNGAGNLRGIWLATRKRSPYQQRGIDGGDSRSIDGC